MLDDGPGRRQAREAAPLLLLELPLRDRHQPRLVGQEVGPDRPGLPRLQHPALEDVVHHRAAVERGHLQRLGRLRHGAQPQHLLQVVAIGAGGVVLQRRGRRRPAQRAVRHLLGRHDAVPGAEPAAVATPPRVGVALVRGPQARQQRLRRALAGRLQDRQPEVGTVQCGHRARPVAGPGVGRGRGRAGQPRRQLRDRAQPVELVHAREFPDRVAGDRCQQQRRGQLGRARGVGPPRPGDRQELRRRLLQQLEQQRLLARPLALDRQHGMAHAAVDGVAFAVKQQRILPHQRREDALGALGQEQRPEAHRSRRRDVAHEHAPPQGVAVVEHGPAQRPRRSRPEARRVGADAGAVQPRQRADLRPGQRQRRDALAVELLLVAGDVVVEHAQEDRDERRPVAAIGQRPGARRQLPHDPAQLLRRLVGAPLRVAASQPLRVEVELILEARPAADHPRLLRVTLPQHRLGPHPRRDARRRDRAGEELEQPVPLRRQQQQVQQHEHRPAHGRVSQRPARGAIDGHVGPSQRRDDGVVGGVVEPVQDRDLVEGHALLARQRQRAPRDLLGLGLAAGGAEVLAPRRLGYARRLRRPGRRPRPDQPRREFLGELQRRPRRIAHQHDVHVGDGRHPAQQLELDHGHVVDARDDQRAAAQRRADRVVGQ